jgi:tetratricopeptide (TPR) repeat protein
MNMALITLGGLEVRGTSLRRPKPLVLLAYLALEGSKTREQLTELFFPDVKDARDSLSSMLTYLRQSDLTALHARGERIATDVICDAVTLLAHLEKAEFEPAVNLYQGPFLPDVRFGEELGDWVHLKRQELAQRLQESVLEGLPQDVPGTLALLERVWQLTKGQTTDADTLRQFYKRLQAYGSALELEVRENARRYGISLKSSLALKKQSPLPRSVASVRSFARELQARLISIGEHRAGLALCLWGAAGIGKSYTLSQLTGGLPFACFSAHATLPVARLVGLIPKPLDLPNWARTILTRLANGEVTTKEEGVDGLAALLVAHAPVALTIEDMHEATVEQLSFWQLLAQTVSRTQGVALITTSRQFPPDAFEPVALEPLTVSEIEELLDLEVNGKLPSEACRWIFYHAGGNPLFSLEYLSFLRHRGHLWSDRGRWHWRVPERTVVPASVEALITQTLQRAGLTPHEKRFLWAKAVLPVDTPEDVLALIAQVQPDELTKIKAQLHKVGILWHGNFVHPLYKELQDELLSSDIRRNLARCIVEIIAPNDPERAAPFVATADLISEHSAAILTAAADRARRAGRNRRAGELLIEAADYLETSHQTQVLLLAAEDLCHTAPEVAERISERILARESSNARATFLLAKCLVRQGKGERAELIISRLPESIRLAQTWVDTTWYGVPQVSVVRSAQIWFDTLLSLRVERCDYQGAVALWRNTPNLQHDATPLAKRDAAFALVNLAEFTEAATLLDEVLRDSTLDPKTRAGLLEVHGSIAFYKCDFPNCLEFLGEAIRLHGESGEPSHKLTHALRFRAMVYWGLCQQHLAIADTEASMQLASDLGSGRDYAISQAYLGVPLTKLGLFERAEEELLQSREVLIRSDAREHLAACEAILSGVYINWQPPGAAVKALRHAYRSLELSEQLGAPVLITQAQIYVAWAEATFGDSNVSLHHANEVVSVSKKTNQRRNIAFGLWMYALALERLNRIDEAVEAFSQAHIQLGTLNLTGYQSQIALERARLIRDVETAREAVRQLKTLEFRGYSTAARRTFPELFRDF